jgi:hypothetical protein
VIAKHRAEPDEVSSSASGGWPVPTAGARSSPECQRRERLSVLAELPILWSARAASDAIIPFLDNAIARTDYAWVQASRRGQHGTAAAVDQRL